MKNYLSIDQGTTSSRAIIFNSNLELVRDSQKEYDLAYPNDGWVELDPRDVIETVKKLEQNLSHIKTPISVSIIGCVVNGPGEAALTDIGITGGGKDSNMLYLNGTQAHKLKNSEILSKVVSQVEKKAKEIEKNK